jgi:hypothetical protein
MKITTTYTFPVTNVRVSEEATTSTSSITNIWRIPIVYSVLNVSILAILVILFKYYLD